MRNKTLGVMGPEGGTFGNCWPISLKPCLTFLIVQIRIDWEHHGPSSYGHQIQACGHLEPGYLRYTVEFIWKSAQEYAKKNNRNILGGPGN